MDATRGRCCLFAERVHLPDANRAGRFGGCARFKSAAVCRVREVCIIRRVVQVSADASVSHARLTNGGVLDSSNERNRVPRVLQATAERGSRRSPAPNQWPACGTSNKTNTVTGGLTRACPDNKAAGRFGGRSSCIADAGRWLGVHFALAPALCLVLALLCSRKQSLGRQWRACALQSFALFYLKPRLSTALFKSPLVLRCRDINGSILPTTPWPSLILYGLIWTTFSPRQDVPQTRMSPELE